MNLRDLFENSIKKMLVIYPGAFHPFHLGHGSVYQYLSNKFSGADVFIATTNDTKKRPFNFEQKKFLATQAGVPANRFVEVVSPYKSPEITSHYDASKTVLIFALSEKDAGRLGGTKKDGSLGYLQPLPKNYNINDLLPMNERGYFIETPVLNFKIAGLDTNSASSIREQYISSSPEKRAVIARELYPKSKQLNKVIQVLNTALDKKNISESPDMGYSKFNDRDNDINNLHWKIESNQHGIEISIGNNPKINSYTDWSNENIFARIRALGFKDSVRINSAYIKPEWFGTGLGQMMYDKLIQTAKNDGYHYVKSDYDRLAPGNKAWGKLAKRYPVNAIPEYINGFGSDDPEIPTGGVKYYQIDLTKINPKINESPDYGYSKFNDRDEDLLNQVKFKKYKYSDSDEAIQFVAIYKKEEVGSIIFTRLTEDHYVDAYPKNFTYDNTLKVDIITVEDEWRSTGLGQLLYRTFIDYTKSKKFNYVVSDLDMTKNAKNAWKRLAANYPVQTDYANISTKGSRSKRIKFYYIDLTKI